MAGKKKAAPRVATIYEAGALEKAIDTYVARMLKGDFGYKSEKEVRDYLLRMGLNRALTLERDRAKRSA